MVRVAGAYAYSPVHGLIDRVLDENANKVYFVFAAANSLVNGELRAAFQVHGKIAFNVVSVPGDSLGQLGGLVVDAI